MRRVLFYGLLILSLTACAGEFTPTPTATASPPPATNTPEVRPSATGTRGVPARQQTLPPTFTPTNTPTATFTPSVTPTPTNTLTPSPVPEAVLCDATFATTNRGDGAAYTVNDGAVLFQIGNLYDTVILRLTVTSDELDVPLVDGVVPNNMMAITALEIDTFPETGEYDWQVRVYQAGVVDVDTDDPGICDEISGSLSVDLDAATFTPAPTETDLAAEATPEVIIVTATPDAEVTPEVRFIVVTATPEPEVTPEIEFTPEVTPEIEPTDDENEDE